MAETPKKEPNRSEEIDPQELLECCLDILDSTVYGFQRRYSGGNDEYVSFNGVALYDKKLKAKFVRLYRLCRDG